MDEKTEELRDIFVDVTDTDAVTETQEESRGSITTDEAEVEERLRSIVGAMQERYGLETSLDRSELVEVVRSFYAGRSDAEIADELEESDTEAAGDGSLVETVARARVELHLVTEDDHEGPIDPGALREYLDAGNRAEENPDVSAAEIATEFGVSESTARHYRRLVEIEAERKLVGDRFRQEFEHVLADRALSDRLTDGIKQDGLDDATEDIETDVSF